MIGKSVFLDSERLVSLVRDLETADAPIPVRNGTALISRSSDDPALKLIWIIPKDAGTVAGDFASWAKGRIAQLVRQGVVALQDISGVTVLAPGAQPVQVQRAPREKIRHLSAATYVWADKFGCADSRGSLDAAKAEALIRLLNARWTPTDERQYVAPSLGLVDEDGAAGQELLDGLTANRPHMEPGIAYVLYGPGGIGKTFFLRRLSFRLAKSSIEEKTNGLPTFCALPALLHPDALETWLSNRALGRLPLPAIRALIRHGVIVPLLDALDELVRGQAREGSIQFLKSLSSYVGGPAGFVLSCRDYYLNVDPLVPEQLPSSEVHGFTFGFFSDQGRRSFIQAKLQLRPEVASRWSQALEREAEATLGTWREVDSLIGHPLFMDAFCAYVQAIPPDQRTRAAANFRFSAPDVFRQIVDRVLERETEKAAPWKAEFGTRLLAPWNEPFSPGAQRDVLLDIVLRVARDGAELTDERITTDPRYKELIHGLYDFSSAANDLEGETPLAKLASLVESQIGRPQPVPSLSAEKGEEAVKSALARSAALFAQHTLANTEPDRPSDLLFALRHRAYFDYFLAEEIGERLIRTVESGTSAAREEFISWCEAHNLFGRYRSAFDFLLWQSRIVTGGVAELRRIGAPGTPTDDLLLSYVVSLGTDLLLRRGGGDVVTISDLTLAPSETSELWLVPDLLPPTVGGVNIARCEFPKVTVSGVGLRGVLVSDSEFQELAVEATRIEDCVADGCFIPTVSIRGDVQFVNTTLDLEVSSVSIDDATRLSLYDCTLSDDMNQALLAAFNGREHLIVERGTVLIPAPSEQEQARSKGRRFVDSLMRLVRKDGRDSWGVFVPKLRGRSVATSSTFDQALWVLGKHNVARRKGDVIELIDAVRPVMYDGRARVGRPRYEDFQDFWDPVVRELDQVL